MDQTEDSHPEAGAAKPVSAGSCLRQERLARRLSLEEVAAAISIRASVLEALENEDRASLPADIFVRGFIRLYAEYLELAPQEVLDLYRQQPALRGTAADVSADILKLQPVKDPVPFSPVRFLVLLTAGLLLGLAAYLGYDAIFSPKAPPPAPHLRETASSSLPALEKAPPAAIAEPGQGETPPASRSMSAPAAVVSAGPASDLDPLAVVDPAPEFTYVLKAHFLENTWLWIQIDEQNSQELTFQKDERRIWRATRKIDLYLGNAGVVELTLNDQPLSGIGEAGKPGRVSIPGDFH